MFRNFVKLLALSSTIPTSATMLKTESNENDALTKLPSNNDDLLFRSTTDIFTQLYTPNIEMKPLQDNNFFAVTNPYWDNGFTDVTSQFGISDSHETPLKPYISNKYNEYVKELTQKANRNLTEAEKKVIELIADENALVAIVLDKDFDKSATPPVDYTNIDNHYLNQLIDPTNNRPDRIASYFAKLGLPIPENITVVKNLSTLEIENRQLGELKPEGYEYQHTVPKSTSLLTTEPYMQLWRGDTGIGFLWNITECNTDNERLVFSRNAGTDNLPLFDMTPERMAQLKKQLEKTPVVSIETLKEINNKAVQEKTTILWNEILVGLPKGKIDAIFAPQDKLYTRARTSLLRTHVIEKLNLNELPIFVIQSQYAKEEDDQAAVPREGVFRVYTAEEREQDLQMYFAEIKEQEAAQSIIQNHTGFAITLSDEEIQPFLNQLENPTNEISGSLIPPQLQFMKFDDDKSIGFIWNIDLCHLSEETLATLNTLRDQNNNAIQTQTMIPANQVSATLPRGEIGAIFSLKNDLENRLKAWNLMLEIKSKLNLNVNIPIFAFISSPYDLYTEELRDTDQFIADSQKLNPPLPLGGLENNHLFKNKNKHDDSSVRVDKKDSEDMSKCTSNNRCSLM